MSLQTIIDSAVTIEINKSKLVAQTLSRSGRLLTASRNWANPWRFTVSPKPIWDWATNRNLIEPIMNSDRVSIQTLQLGQNTGSAWLIEYQGTAPRTSGVLDNVYLSTYSGSALTVNVSGITGSYTLVKAGDIIQMAGTGSDDLEYRYPYTVTADVSVTTGDTTKVINVHRGFIAQANYDPLSSTNNQRKIKVGTACKWYVQVTQLPNIKMIPGGFAEFTGDFGLTEAIQ
jgi:hypothetical protein